MESAASAAAATARRRCFWRITSVNQRRMHIDRGPENSREVEELRLAEGAVIVMNGNLDDPEAGVVDLLHQLEADDAAGLLQLDALENRTPHQPEIAVDVAHRQAEQDADDVVVDPADHDAVKRIRAADLVAVDQIDAGPHPRATAAASSAGIVLRVAVRVEDQFLRRGSESGLQRAAVAAVLRVVDDPDRPGRSARARRRSRRWRRRCRR